MTRRSQFFHLVTLVVFAHGARASAQSFETPRAAVPPWMAEPPPTLLVDMVGDEPMTITVYSTDDIGPERTIFSCTTPCQARLYPGRYRFHVRSANGEKIEADRVIEVTASEQLVFSLPKKSSKTMSLTLAISGSALIPAGLLVALASAYSSSCMDCPPEESRNRDTPAGVYVGLGMALVGAILTPIGWIGFANSRRPSYETAPVGSPPRSPPPAKKDNERASPRVGFGVAPTRGGASAGVWGSF